MKILGFLVLLVLLAGCHTSKMANKAIDKKYAKHDFIFKTLHSENYDLTYWDNQSDKPILLLLHGFGTWAKFNWHKQIEDLGAEYRVIIPNLLHFGKSTCTACGYTIDDQVAAIDFLIESLEIDHLYLAGASYGGVVAIELTQKIPDKVDKLIIIDSPVKFFTKEEITKVEQHFEVDNISELLIPKDHKALKYLTKILYKNPPITPTFAYKSIYDELILPYKTEMTMALNSLIESRSYFASQEYAYTKPILLIWGDEDMLIPKKVGYSLSDYFNSNSELIIIQNTAHMPILEKPKACNEAILNFLLETDRN